MIPMHSIPSWILIEFLNVFDVQKGTGDPGLDAKLQTPEELSGLLNIALAGLARLRANEWVFSYDKTVEDVEVMYKRNSNPVLAFLMDECLPGGVKDYIEKTEFANRFNEYVKANGLRPLSSTKFSELLKDQTEIPVSSVRLYNAYDDRPHCWQGIKFRPPLWPPDLDSPYWGHDIDFRDAGNESLTGELPIPSRLLPTPSFPEKELQEEIKKVSKGKIGITGSMDGMGSSPDIDPEFRRTRWNTCIVCGRDFDYDLAIHYENGFICQRCHSEGRTIETKPQPKKPERLCAKCHNHMGMSAIKPGLGEICMDCLEVVGA
jgi:hypothetical protein